jgi:hypothetical protein
MRVRFDGSHFFSFYLIIGFVNDICGAARSVLDPTELLQPSQT